MKWLAQKRVWCYLPLRKVVHKVPTREWATAKLVGAGGTCGQLSGVSAGSHGRIPSGRQPSRPIASRPIASRPIASRPCLLNISLRKLWVQCRPPHRLAIEVLALIHDLCVCFLPLRVAAEIKLRQHAIVLSCDEKSRIQALDRTQPGLSLKKGRCQTMTH